MRTKASGQKRFGVFGSSCRNKASLKAPRWLSYTALISTKIIFDTLWLTWTLTVQVLNVKTLPGFFRLWSP